MENEYEVRVDKGVVTLTILNLEAIILHEKYYGSPASIHAIQFPLSELPHLVELLSRTDYQSTIRS